MRSRHPFLDGIARIFDFGGALRIRRPKAPSPRTDQEAIESDWQAVWGDMRTLFDRSWDRHEAGYRRLAEDDGEREEPR